MRFEPRRLEGNDDVTVVDVHATGTGRGSGVPVEWDTYLVFRWRGDRVIEAFGFLERDRALEVAGL